MPAVCRQSGGGGGDACELRYDLVERGALRSRLLSQLYDELTNTATDLTPLMAERLLTTYYQLLRDIQGDTIPAEPPPPPPPPKRSRAAAATRFHINMTSIHKAMGEATHNLIVLFISVLLGVLVFIVVLCICAYSFSEHDESYGRGSPVEEPAGEGSLNCDPRCEK